MSRYFCHRCSAESDEQVCFCLACGTSGAFVPQLYLQRRAVEGLRYRTARQLAYGKTITHEVFGLGPIPKGEPIGVAVYGPPGGGKSSLMLAMARSLADAEIKSVYVSAEEGFGSAVSGRLKYMELCSDDVFFVEVANQPSVVEFAAARGAEWVFLDSYQVSRWTLPEVIGVKRHAMSVVFSLQITKAGDPAGEMAVVHEADVVVAVDGFRWKQEKNRFGALLEGEVRCG